MYRPELLKDLLLTIHSIKQELAGTDGDKAYVAQEAYDELLNGFCEEYEDMLVPDVVF